MDSDCVFCRIARGEIASDVVLERGEVLAFRDLNPMAPVHVLVIPKRHVRDVADLGPGDGGLMAGLLSAANEVAAAEGIDRSGYRLVLNRGPDAGQSVFHLHLHLLGGRPMRWPPG